MFHTGPLPSAARPGECGVRLPRRHVIPGNRREVLFGYSTVVSPTVLRVSGYRFYFFSREELREHVHVQHESGQAKFWLEPEVALAHNYELSTRQLSTALRLIKEHEDEIRAAWKEHFDR
jgi:hypothetical protein